MQLDLCYTHLCMALPRQKVLPTGILRAGLAGGVLIYALVGVANLILGANYLEYTPLADTMKEGQHLGIFLVELELGLTVASVMMTVYFTFATWREDWGVIWATGIHCRDYNYWIAIFLAMTGLYIVIARGDQ